MRKVFLEERDGLEPNVSGFVKNFEWKIIRQYGENVTE